MTQETWAPGVRGTYFWEEFGYLNLKEFLEPKELVSRELCPRAACVTLTALKLATGPEGPGFTW